MKRLYKIKDGIRPYPGKILESNGLPDERKRVWGYVRIDRRRKSGLKAYYLHHLEPIQEELFNGR